MILCDCRILVEVALGRVALGQLDRLAQVASRLPGRLDRKVNHLQGQRVLLVNRLLAQLVRQGNRSPDPRVLLANRLLVQQG